MYNKNKIKDIINNIQHEIDLLRAILAETVDGNKLDANKLARKNGIEENLPNGKIVEGVFDGEKMIGPDGKEYLVPPNYASKSKLVEGDILKLTIVANGSFLFKKIGPVARDRIIGELYFDPEKKEYWGRADDRTYKLITASVTYFKGESGDQVIMLTPKDAVSKWAAVENIIKKIASTTIPEHNDITENEVTDIEEE